MHYRQPLFSLLSVPVIALTFAAEGWAAVKQGPFEAEVKVHLC